MKLLFVGTNRGTGGAETHFIALATAMAEAGHDVAAVARPGDVIFRGLERYGRIPLFPGYFRKSTDAQGIRSVLRASKLVQPDWIVGSFVREYKPLGVIARVRRTRLALFRHDVLRNLSPMMHYLVPRAAQRFIVPSHFMRNWMIARGMPAERVHVLYNAVDAQHFTPCAQDRSDTRAQLGFGDGDVVIGFAGSLARNKGVHSFIRAVDRAMTALPQLRTLWMGDGEEAADVFGLLWASPHRERHVTTGWVDDVAPFFRAIDILAIPSECPESFGRVSIEAQACGVPVLASASGGLPESLHDGVTGVLLPPGDVDAWASAIVALAQDNVLRCGMGTAGRELVLRRFDSPIIAAQFAELLDTAPRAV